MWSQRAVDETETTDIIRRRRGQSVKGRQTMGSVQERQSSLRCSRRRTSHGNQRRHWHGYPGNIHVRALLSFTIPHALLRYTCMHARPYTGQMLQQAAIIFKWGIKHPLTKSIILLVLENICFSLERAPSSLGNGPGTKRNSGKTKLYFVC